MSDIDKLRQACRKSLWFLCTEMLGYRDWDSIHYEIEDFLKASGNRKMLMIPRNHLKTSIVTIGYTIKTLLEDPNKRVLIANQVWDRARDMLFSIKELLTTKSDLPKIFGEFVSHRWTADDIVVRQRTKALAAASVATTGVEAETTSSHYDLIIADDLQGLQNMQTPEQREKVKRFYRSLSDLLEPSGKMIVVGTRWHQDDLYADIMEREGKYYSTMVKRVVEDGKPIFPKKFTLEHIEYLKASKPLDEFYCTPGETPILMADWKTRPIENVKVGDEIIGFTLGAGRNNGSLVKTRVRRTFSKVDHVLKLVMKSGRTVLCTKEHKWYTGRVGADASHLPYAPAKIGSELRFVCPVEEKTMSTQEQLDWSYFAGLFDGEGSCRSGGCLTISQSQSKNASVYSKITSVMDRLGIKYGLSVRQENNTAGRRQSPGNTQFWMRDSFDVGLNLIRNTQCGKADQLADRFLKFGKKFAREKDEVVDIKYDSLRTVYALETETGNYIAWGYASSNSQYMNEPIASENQLFRDTFFKYFSRRPDNLYVCMTADLAISEKQSADNTAFVVTGMDPAGNMYVLDYLFGKWTPSKIIENTFKLRAQWRPNTIGFETNGFQRTLKFMAEDHMRDTGDYFRIEELVHGARDSKEGRIKALEPMYRMGKVYHAEWMKGKDMEAELMSFPKGRHDDIIDALCSQVELLRRASQSHAPDVVKPGTLNYLLKYQMGGSHNMYDEFLKDAEHHTSTDINRILYG